MKHARFAAFCLLLATLPSCARTVYTNLHPELPKPAEASEMDPKRAYYWRHFYVWGWVPEELVIDAAAYCNGTARIERIETQEAFVQGLIASVAGYYVNVYSPYTGRVVCDRHAMTE